MRGIRTASITTSIGFSGARSSLTQDRHEDGQHVGAGMGRGVEQARCNVTWSFALASTSTNICSLETLTGKSTVLSDFIDQRAPSDVRPGRAGSGAEPCGGD
jgi:hypothetical protein